MSLITAEQTFQLAAVMIGLASFGFWVETTHIGRKLSGVLIILSLGVVLANIRLIPHTAAMYDTVSSLLVPLAIPMLLFKADLKQVIAVDEAARIAVRLPHHVGLQLRRRHTVLAHRFEHSAVGKFFLGDGTQSSNKFLEAHGILHGARVYQGSQTPPSHPPARDRPSGYPSRSLRQPRRRSGGR